jgi:hypothetical protein
MSAELAVGPIATEYSFDLDEIQAHVQSDLMGRVLDLRLSNRGMGLVLRGQARTYYAKQLAQQAVMKLTTIPIIANDIEVI